MGSSERVLARRYAQAFLDFSKTSFSQDLLYALKKAIDYFTKHSSVAVLLNIPLIDPVLKIQALDSVLIDQYHLPKKIHDLISLLVDDKRAFLIKEVLQELYDLYLKQADVMTFVISSSAPLSDDQKKIVEQFLTKKIGRILLYEYKIDPTLIAGIRIQSDTMLWEYSVAQQLMQAERAMLNEIEIG